MLIEVCAQRKALLQLRVCHHGSFIHAYSTHPTRARTGLFTAAETQLRGKKICSALRHIGNPTSFHVGKLNNDSYIRWRMFQSTPTFIQCSDTLTLTLTLPTPTLTPAANSKRRQKSDCSGLSPRRTQCCSLIESVHHVIAQEKEDRL